MDTKNLKTQTKKYLDHLHPEGSPGMICPRGTQWNEYLGGPMGEEWFVDEKTFERWSGCVNSGWQDPVTGKREWMVRHLASNAPRIMLKSGDRGNQKWASIEQVSLNAFSKIDVRSCGKAVDTIGLKNILLDFDGVSPERAKEFLAWLDKTGIPMSFAVLSGKKGVHVAICLSEIITDKAEADRLCKAIGEVLLEAGGDSWSLDVGTLIGDRKYTSAIRLPGLIRVETGATQCLVAEWRGSVQRSVLEAWITEKLPTWRNRKRWKIDAKAAKSGSYSGSAKEGTSEAGYAAMREHAASIGLRHTNKHFYVPVGNTHYRRLDWSKDEPTQFFWQKYQDAVGNSVSAGKFSDLLSCLANEFAVPPACPPNKINVANGVLDLDTLTLEPHSLKHQFNYCLNVEIDVAMLKAPPASAAWSKIVDEHIAAPEDKELLEAFLAYTITDDKSKPQMLVLYGPSDTGKSVLLNFHERLLGSELVAKENIARIIADPAYAANIVDKRLSIATEARLTPKDVEIFKSLVSFEAVPIHIYHVGKSTVSHSCKFICSSNQDGWLPSHDEIKKRMRIVKFHGRVPVEKQDRDLLERLWIDRKAIVHRMLAAYLKYKEASQFPLNQSTIAYLSRAHENVNSVLPWVNDIELENGDDWLPNAFFHYLYRQASGDKNLSQAEFGRKLSDAGIDSDAKGIIYNTKGEKITDRVRGRKIKMTPALQEAWDKWPMRLGISFDLDRM